MQFCTMFYLNFSCPIAAGVYTSVETNTDHLFTFVWLRLLFGFFSNTLICQEGSLTQQLSFSTANSLGDIMLLINSKKTFYNQGGRSDCLV